MNAISRIIISDQVISELRSEGYSQDEVLGRLESITPVLVFVESTVKAIGRSKDLAGKRQVPRGDALHALLARDQQAILVSWDRHFFRMSDIVKARYPSQLI